MATSHTPNWDLGWFDPKSLYGGTQYQTSASFGTSPAGHQYYNKNPDIYYNRTTLPYASGNDAFSQFVRSRQNLFQQGYAAALGSNPNLSVQDYAHQIGLNQQLLRQQFMQQAPQQRNVDYSAYGGRMRWTP